MKQACHKLRQMGECPTLGSTREEWFSILEFNLHPSQFPVRWRSFNVINKNSKLNAIHCKALGQNLSKLKILF